MKKILINISQAILMFLLLSISNYLAIFLISIHENYAYSNFSNSHLVVSLVISATYFFLQFSRNKFMKVYLIPVTIFSLSTLIILFDLLTRRVTEIGELWFILLSKISLLYGNCMYLITEGVINEFTRFFIASTLSSFGIAIYLLILIFIVRRFGKFILNK